MKTYRILQKRATVYILYATTQKKGKSLQKGKSSKVLHKSRLIWIYDKIDVRARHKSREGEIS
jgi:hypothetical protein